MAINTYRDLEVWQRAMHLVRLAYRLAGRLPRSEAFGLALQIRRSAVSIPSNIAEGHGRLSRGEYAHHAAIAHGSLMELETQLEIATQLEFFAEAEVREAVDVAAEVGRMLRSLIRRLRVTV